MIRPALAAVAAALLADGKGLLAIDESNATCDRRFAAAGIPQTLQMRRAWRELLLTAPGLGDFISGVILYDETLGQSTADGTPFVAVARAAGLAVGIKVDIGAKPLAAHPGEQVTEGLDGLRLRLLAYAARGACFAKWRAVFTVATASPSGIEANAHALARYAALCQEAGLVPIVEPELLMDGDHPLARGGELAEVVLRGVFAQLAQQRVQLEAMILKPAMVLAGSECAEQPGVAAIAEATLRCLRRSVPAAVPGIAFLSGGQAGAEATARLNAMHAGAGAGGAALPWRLSFSFGRALQQPALSIWAGDDRQRVAAQQALLHRARCNAAALRGRYQAAMEDR